MTDDRSRQVREAERALRIKIQPARERLHKTIVQAVADSELPLQLVAELLRAEAQWYETLWVHRKEPVRVEKNA